MPRVHSHYDNLKIARDAAPEAIRVAYRALTRQHHPDRNPENRDAARVMALVNVAYSVLSDPAKRREHDQWIERTEAEPLTAIPVVHRTTAHSPVRPAAGQRNTRTRRSAASRRAERARPWRRAILFGVVGLGVFWGGSQAIDRWQSGSGPRAVLTPSLAGRSGEATTTAGSAPWVRAPLAPNGQAWPRESGYLESYPQLNGAGLSEVSADNRGSPADKLVKLVSLDGPTPLPVRTFLVTAGSRFVLTSVTNGIYDLRWRNLHTGTLMRTPPFILEEVSTARGMQPTRMAVELEPHGETGQPRPYALGDGDF